MVRKTMIFISIIAVFIHTGCNSFDKIPSEIIGASNKDIENRLEFINGTYKLSPPDVVEIDEF